MATRTIRYSEALRATRELLGWTQVQAAAEIGMPLRTYQAHEQGTETPSIEFVNERVAPVMGWELAFMVSEEVSDKRAWFNPSVLVPHRPGELLLGVA